MPYSARALGQDGLRLRSRRVRRDRSQRLSWLLAVTVVMVAGLWGLVGASVGPGLRIPSLVPPGLVPGPSSVTPDALQGNRAGATPQVVLDTASAPPTNVESVRQASIDAAFARSEQQPYLDRLLACTPS